MDQVSLLRDTVSKGLQAPVRLIKRPAPTGEAAKRSRSRAGGP